MTAINAMRRAKQFIVDAGGHNWGEVVDGLNEAISRHEALIGALGDLVSLTKNGWHGANRESLDGKYFLGGLNRARKALADAEAP